MNYLLSFIFCGIVCAVSQFVLEKSKLTPGHINTGLVIIGCVLSGFGIYDKLISIFHAGATVPIINFGHLLVMGAYEGYKTYGIIGLFKGILVNSSAGISVAVLMAFIISLFFKVKH
ncbi:MAG: SpoVA/SpoVAEb family sporulation membrane protein [Bacilli bacterium]|nr:SpoVA/SpoVAEb family sporulation membrane protein [Bacilli bacterium]